MAPPPRFGDYSRARSESRVAFGGPDEDAEEIATPSRRFTVWEITSGLPDDSREADEKEVQRRLRDLRASVKAARTVVSTTPGLSGILATDWRKAARFYTLNGITEQMFRNGVPAEAATEERTEGASLALMDDRTVAREELDVVPLPPGTVGAATLTTVGSLRSKGVLLAERPHTLAGGF